MLSKAKLWLFNALCIAILVGIVGFVALIVVAPGL